MSLTNIKTKLQSERGFTIVELLIVIVVIAILAAITIVSYNGITNKANSSAAASNAANVQKKVELYAADDTTGSGYPTDITVLTNSTNSSKAWYISGINLQVANPTSSNGKTTVSLLKCVSSGSPANQAAITANVSGMRITYFDFENPSTLKTINTGVTTTCPTT